MEKVYLYGVKGVELVYHNTQADPEIKIKGKYFNALDVENALWEMAREDNGDIIDIDIFNQWLDDNHNYLKTLIESLTINCQGVEYRTQSGKVKYVGGLK